ncbi:LOW QUALITY PROTEIN: Pol protein [Phytophthora palmivora]|uniref:Pol protein n=1 Tax=Phytophthora palmivora TaxID=4796 RepID=A0A2P4XF65_9STRA|nr:LOW QUALITY PROTEIN: Pol protein [Phytophthora palmivora]
MSTVDHPQTDGQTERVNRVLEDTLRIRKHLGPGRTNFLWLGLYSAMRSTGFTPFYLNELRHPQVPLTLRGGTVASIVSGGEARKAFSSQVSNIETKRQAGVNQPEQTKEYSDKNGRGNLSVFMVGDLVVLDAEKLPLLLVSPVESSKLKHRFIRPFRGP